MIKETKMDDRASCRSFSRRGFLRTGTTAVAAGIIGTAAGMTTAAANQANPATVKLPWPWARIDPMEAGSRAYHYYHESGG
jgi:hypothetical protein